MKSIAFMLALFAAAAPLPTRAQGVATPGARPSLPPVVVHGDGGFRARRLTQPPTIDGREWVAADVRSGDASPIVRAPDGTFSLTFRDAGTDTGDLERYQLYLARGRGALVRIDQGLTAWAWVTPDSRYVVTEPLYVLDIRQWRQYALFEALGIPNYVSIEAVSRDGRRLLVSRSDCAFDCGDRQREYYEVTLPRRRPPSVTPPRKPPPHA